MKLERRITIKAIKTKDNELIPIWDERLVFEKTEMYGNIIRLKDNYRDSYFELIECIYDLKTKQIEIGIELNYYPTEKDLEVQIDKLKQKSPDYRKSWLTNLMWWKD